MYENLSHEDLIQIFTDCIFLYKKKPIYVHNISEEGNLFIESFGTMESKEVSVTDEDFDFSPIPLGMCNIFDTSVYLSRMPKRQYKQGLHSANLYVQTLEGKKDADLVPRILQTRNHFLIDTINGVYPSIEEACKLLKNGERKSVAFNRYFALNKKHDVFFKTKRVGIFNQKKSDFVFSKDTEYLEELL